MQNVIKYQQNLDVLEDKVGELLVKAGKVVGIKTESHIPLEMGLEEARIQPLTRNLHQQIRGAQEPAT